MKVFTLIVSTLFLFSCTKEKKVVLTQKTIDTIRIVEKDTVLIEKKLSKEQIAFFIQERLPDWFLETELIDGSVFNKNYMLENSLNPFYLEADFNGDSIIDIVIPIYELKTEKRGFAIIHGKTHDIHIIGAGNKIKNALSDDMFYVDIWKINRKKTNSPGIDNNKPLILKTDSLELLKSEVGGGLIFWNGNNYEYFHQTC